MVRNIKVVAAIIIVALLAACNTGPMTPLPEEDGGMLTPTAVDTLPR